MLTVIHLQITVFTIPILEFLGTECAKRKSNVQADLHSLHVTERPFSGHTIYIYIYMHAGFEECLKRAYTVDTLKQH